MAKIKTPKGIYYFHPKNLTIHKNTINRDVAFENLKVVVRILQDANIQMSPAFGTLLGIIRENNFIEWDTDIDLFVLSEYKDKLLESLWLMKDEGLELVRVDRCNHLYSVMRNGEYIDFYIMDRVSPEIRTSYGDTFMFEKYLIDLIDWDFRGLSISVPREYDQCLEFLYGDWRTPVKYFKTKHKRSYTAKKHILFYLKPILPFSIRFWLLKRHHRKDLEKFLAKCKQKNVNLQYKINW